MPESDVWSVVLLTSSSLPSLKQRLDVPKIEEPSKGRERFVSLNIIIVVTSDLNSFEFPAKNSFDPFIVFISGSESRSGEISR